MRNDIHSESDTPLTDFLTQEINSKLSEIGHDKRLDINKIKKNHPSTPVINQTKEKRSWTSQLY